MPLLQMVHLFKAALKLDGLAMPNLERLALYLDADKGCADPFFVYDPADPAEACAVLAPLGAMISGSVWPSVTQARDYGLMCCTMFLPCMQRTLHFDFTSHAALHTHPLGAPGRHAAEKCPRGYACRSRCSPASMPRSGGLMRGRAPRWSRRRMSGSSCMRTRAFRLAASSVCAHSLAAMAATLTSPCAGQWTASRSLEWIHLRVLKHASAGSFCTLCLGGNGSILCSACSATVCLSILALQCLQLSVLLNCCPQEVPVASSVSECCVLLSLNQLAASSPVCACCSWHPCSLHRLAGSNLVSACCSWCPCSGCVMACLFA